MKVTALVLGGGALLGLVAGSAYRAGPAILAPSYGETIHGCRIIDGDTLRCGTERIRLLGIDAPEMPGHCRAGRQCVDGDPFASTRSLAAAKSDTMQIERYGQDAYGRTLAAIAGEKGDLSCHQLRTGHAIYVADWDNNSRIARTCPTALFHPS
jgi:micrococcal nuclease